MKSWLDYWNTDTPIYVSARHKVLHYEGIARDIAALVPSAEAAVLDHASGDALAAETVAARCASLTLCEAAPAILARLNLRFAGHAKISVTDPAALADSSIKFDLIVVSSLLQYLKPEELQSLLALLRAKLRDSGALIIADVIPPGVSPVTDALALLRFAARGEFFFAALAGLARTFFSNYRKLRGELGLSMYSEAAMLALLKEHGFSARRMAKNIGHNPARMTFEGKKG